jgi:diguanylate cyclase (GGDEF)-like protein
MSEQSDEAAAVLPIAAVLAAIKDTVRWGAPPAALTAALADEDELREILTYLGDLHTFTTALAAGNLDERFAHKGALAGGLKSLQAALRHLTWQTQRIAAGDFTQRVDFMGDFATAFNHMVAALATARELLEEREAALRQANEALQADIEARRIIEEQLRILATTDPLTGLYNRRHLETRLQETMQLALRYQLPFSCCLCDIDYFKAVNDTYGHAVGDVVLKMMGQLITEELRETDFAGRIGGDEFCLIFPNTSAEIALPAVTRLCARVRDTIITSDGITLSVTGSFGVADGIAMLSHETLLQRADAALYQAKAAGRDQVALAAALVEA